MILNNTIRNKQECKCFRKRAIFFSVNIRYSTNKLTNSKPIKPVPDLSLTGQKFNPKILLVISSFLSPLRPKLGPLASLSPDKMSEVLNDKDDAK